MYKFLHVTPVITVTFLLFLTVFVLFFAFKKSLELFNREVVEVNSEGRLFFAWALQVFLFVAIAWGIELYLSPSVGNPKVMKVLTVFINLVVFFLTYYLSVKVILERRKD
jgi:Mn2+/Fe2+ NRAMP family transporter